jgi:hypothetical protein
VGWSRGSRSHPCSWSGGLDHELGGRSGGRAAELVMPIGSLGQPCEKKPDQGARFRPWAQTSPDRQEMWLGRHGVGFWEDHDLAKERRRRPLDED